MEIIFEKDFVKSARGLPKETKRILGLQVEIFRKNQNDPRLHGKSLSGKLNGFYSFRVTRDYRVIYYFENKNTAVFIDVGNRKDIYK